MLGLRGVGKTVLLNRIDQIAETAGCRTTIFEADPDRTLPELLTEQLNRLLLKLDLTFTPNSGHKPTLETPSAHIAQGKVPRERNESESGYKTSRCI
jgi:pimeloyl-ACP methyl ester carboxylesterase